MRLAAKYAYKLKKVHSNVFSNYEEKKIHVRI